MTFLKPAALLIFLLAAASCNDANTADDAVETHTQIDSSGMKKARSKKATWKFTEFEESIVSKVDALPLVQRKNKEIDSASVGARHLIYNVEKVNGKPNVYAIRVSEDRNGTPVEHFVFEVDSVTGTILNPDGRR